MFLAGLECATRMLQLWLAAGSTGTALPVSLAPRHVQPTAEHFGYPGAQFVEKGGAALDAMRIDQQAQGPAAQAVARTSAPGVTT
ncbi:hypothetical protein AIOL_002599 [Candidatus Rhodobacter oscarellae]|uniref:Uncharacterized protein n=1 Tax=Candidatus Rhodobacter oscarellae TaxID=1675527 RepID=A0A0J9E780_9RHOB|nr:hypothetical protein AIOL_002599 [Candidatus Rhodobacter lobularis]